jgi:hypothetical protein
MMTIISTTKWLMVLALAGLFLTVPNGALAGMVYGKVLNAQGDTFHIDSFIVMGGPEGPMTVYLDEHNRYSVYLPEGTYTAECQVNNRLWRAVLRSFPQPYRQNLYFAPVEQEGEGNG